MRRKHGYICPRSRKSSHITSCPKFYSKKRLHEHMKRQHNVGVDNIELKNKKGK